MTLQGNNLLFYRRIKLLSAKDSESMESVLYPLKSIMCTADSHCVDASYCVYCFSQIYIYIFIFEKNYIYMFIIYLYLFFSNIYIYIWNYLWSCKALGCCLYVLLFVCLCFEWKVQNMNILNTSGKCWEHGRQATAWSHQPVSHVDPHGSLPLTTKVCESSTRFGACENNR